MNPYDPPLTACPTKPITVRRSAREQYLLWAGVGAGIAAVGSVPLAGLIGAFFRFPVPMAGYVSGPEGFLWSMVAAIMYGALGGVLVQLVAGSVGGVISYELSRRYGAPPLRFVIVGGLLSALPGLLLLAVLDWFIGPW
jgi:hypothetical protein